MLAQTISNNQNQIFINKIKETMLNVSGYDSYGDEYDFFDEDGIVLIKVIDQPEEDLVKVIFCLSDEVFDIAKNKSDLSLIAN